MPIENRVVLITGASSGFGRLTAEHLARKRYSVIATMRDLSGKNAGAAAELRLLARGESLDLHVAELDVTQDASVDRCVRETIARAGRIDVLVNNAGFGHKGLTESFTVQQAQRIFDTNFFGVVRMIRAVLPHMHKQGSGLLLQVSSGAGRVVLPAMGFYCASKHALEALTDAYRYELAGAGIDSVSIQPGAYATAIFRKIEHGADVAREDQYTAAKEFAPRINAFLEGSKADPMEIAEAILQIIETPAGQRRVRYRVGRGATGVEAINETAAQMQAQLLAGYGLGDIAQFRASSAGAKA